MGITWNLYMSHVFAVLSVALCEKFAFLPPLWSLWNTQMHLFFCTQHPQRHILHSHLFSSINTQRFAELAMAVAPSSQRPHPIFWLHSRGAVTHIQREGYWMLEPGVNSVPPLHQSDVVICWFVLSLAFVCGSHDDQFPWWVGSRNCSGSAPPVCISLPLSRCCLGG